MLKYAKDSGVRSFAFGVAILVYAVELGSLTLSIDEEIFAYQADPWTDWVLPQGRWALALLGYMVPPFANTPFVATAVFCAGLAFSALLLASCFARSRSEAFAFVGLFVSCPIWLHIAETNSLSPAFAVALCLSATAVALIHFGGYRSAIPAGILTGFALGIYQALLPLVVCGSLLSVALSMHDASRSQSPSLKDILRRLGPAVVTSAIAVVLYIAVTRLALFLLGQPLTYVTRFVRVDDFASRETLSAAIVRTLQQLKGLLIGSDPTFIRGRWGLTSLLPFWIGAIAATIGAFWRGREQVRATWAAAALVLGFALCAFAPVIVSAGTAPTRTLLAVPLVYAAGAASMMKNDWFDRKPQWVALSVAIFLNMWIAATLFHADAMARERDGIMAAQLAERIAALPGVQRDHPRKLILHGEWKHDTAWPALRVEWFGTSFFEMDGGNPWRVERYLRLLGVGGLRGAYITCAQEDLAELERLPDWPAPGSVALVRDNVVIKFGPLSDNERKNLAEAPCESGF